VTQAVDDAVSGYVANEAWSGKGGSCGGGNTYPAGKAGKSGKSGKADKAGKASLGGDVSASSTAYQTSSVAVGAVGAVLAVVAAVLVAVRRRRFASEANTIDMVVEMEFVDDSVPAV